MSTTSLPDLLTFIERATWIVDNAVIVDLPEVDLNGQIVPGTGTPGAGRPLVAELEARLRDDPRGINREGLTVRLYLILLITCAWLRRVWVSDMYTLATGMLPVEVQRELGILYWTSRRGPKRLRQIEAKQLYDLAGVFRKKLDTDPDLELTPEVAAQREQFLDQVKDALLVATHVLRLTGTSFAVDETGVWSWIRGRSKPKSLPLVDPADEDGSSEQHVKPVLDANAAEADRVLTIDPDAAAEPDLVADEAVLDEDSPDYRPDEQAGDAANAAEANPAAGAPTTSPRPADRKMGKRCWMSSWGVKIHKSGKRSAYFGVSMHTLVRVPDLLANKRGDKSVRYSEPLLVEQFELTPASSDLVAPTLHMVKKLIGRGTRVQDLLGDRHYSYKRFDRWAAPLWQMKVRPVLDLRADDHKSVPYGGGGVVIVAGTPHLCPPPHLQSLARPGKGASKQEMEAFATAIAERELYAFKRRKTAWSRNDGKPGGDGRTRWLSPVMAGSVGCSHLPDSVATARLNGQPVLNADDHDAEQCLGELWVEPGQHMKYQQEQYWGSRKWLDSWNRRTYVEAVFGNLKNYSTGNIHRGYMQFTGKALMTFGLTAAVVAYNLRELENWHERASTHCPDNPLLEVYRQHPLHRKTKWVHGFSMMTEQQRARFEQDWQNEELDGHEVTAIAA